MLVNKFRTTLIIDDFCCHYTLLGLAIEEKQKQAKQGQQTVGKKVNITKKKEIL